jgi:Protein of unknown function (DUF2924)
MNVAKEVALLQKLTTKQLRERYAEVFRESTAANNRIWLIRRIVWRIQALAEGDLSERAKRRAEELANDADLRIIPPKSVAAPATTSLRLARWNGDDRLPPPGSVITRQYKGQSLQVLVRPDGFEYEGEHFVSLSAVAKAITGSHCNGFLFFRSALGSKGGKR